MKTRIANPPALTAKQFEDLPRRIFLDSCTVQTLRKYGEFIYDGGSIMVDDRIHQIPDGFENVIALRDICHITSRALFQWIVSDASYQEAQAKRDPDHLSWLCEVAHYARSFLEEIGPSPESKTIATRLDELKFGYLGVGDRVLLKDAVFMQCDSFLTMERKLPRNAAHIERELGIRVLTPITYWERLRPWGAIAGSW
jgi:hypothetical protein